MPTHKLSSDHIAIIAEPRAMAAHRDRAGTSLTPFPVRPVSRPSHAMPCLKAHWFFTSLGIDPDWRLAVLSGWAAWTRSALHVLWPGP